MRYYYADLQNKPVGPYPLEELQQLFINGDIKDETYVIEEGGNEWKKYSSLLEILDSVGRLSEKKLIYFKPPTSKWAMTSFISSLIGIVLPLVIPQMLAIWCGHIARAQLKNNSTLRGNGLAIGGLFIGYFGLALCVMGMVIWFILFGILLVKGK